MEQLQKKLDSLHSATPVALKEDRAEVNFGSKFKEEIVRKLYNSWITKAEYSNKVFKLTEEQVVKYCNTLFALRVDSIERTKDYKNKALYKSLRVPALMALVFAAIGKVHDREIGFTLIPVHSLPKKDYMSDEELEKISYQLANLEDLGFVMIEGLPRDQKGNPDFMYFNITKDTITRHNSSAPSSLAILTSFFDTLQLKATLTQTVDYGTTTMYDELLSNLIYDSGR